jgi:hypothetical protein
MGMGSTVGTIAGGVLGGYFTGGAGTAQGAAAGAAIGGSLGDGLLGSGQKVAVPGAMARPTDPVANYLGKDSFVKDQFKLGGFNPESQQKAQAGLDRLSTMSQASGPSPYAQSLINANNLQGVASRGQAANGLASARATAESQLATKGGMGTGSRERLAQLGMQSGMTANQDINRQTGLNNMNVLAQDEDRKFSLAKDLPQQYMQLANADIGKQRFDIQNSIQIGSNSFSEQMKAYAANQAAIGQASSANAASKGLLGIF